MNFIKLNLQHLKPVKIFPHYKKFLHNQHQKKKSFYERMSEALEKVAEEAPQKEAEKKVAAESTKEFKQMKKNLKKRKWDWRTEDEQKKAEDVKRAAFNPADRVKRKKTAILLSYCGANYYGMQRNPGMSTIEEELFKAMVKHKWITEESFEQAQQACFQRAARTDKGVSAARQVCSLKLPLELDLKALNADLPEDIRCFGAERVTKGFNSKDQCNARTYTYTLPTISFAPFESKPDDILSFRLEKSQLDKINETLKLYEGTKNFHNFTSRKHFHDPSAKRFIVSFTSSEPFLSPQGIEFVTLKVKGQSFMLHQIRKMVGLAIAIVRGNTTAATLERALGAERLDLPMSPGLGLVLDTVHYERYNERYGNDGIHQALTWEAQEEDVNAFIEKYIFSKIYEIEFQEKPMLEWLETLIRHSYEPRQEETTSQQATKNKDDDNKDDNDE